MASRLKAQDNSPSLHEDSDYIYKPNFVLVNNFGFGKEKIIDDSFNKEMTVLSVFFLHEIKPNQDDLYIHISRRSCEAPKEPLCSQFPISSLSFVTYVFFCQVRKDEE